MDFTLKTYTRLLKAISQSGYCFLTFSECIRIPVEKYLVLRHDVDKRPEMALEMARLEAEMGVRASYYFRVKTFDVTIVQQIAALGHEIAYHYEDLAVAKGNISRALVSFEKNLYNMRQFASIETIAMHGSPFSKFDNRTIWANQSYKDFGLIGEPYFDFIGKKHHFYFTDTGRSWNSRGNRRDKQMTGCNEDNIKSTNELIDYLSRESNPLKCMISAHPQRWTDNKVKWIKELVFQSVKNILKKILPL